MKKYFSLVGSALALAVLGSLGVAVYAWQRIGSASEGRVFSDIDDIPSRKVGLVLGCSPTLPDGRENLFFRYRMEAAEALFKADKVAYLLVSGDNRTEGYDEATAMRDALVERGIPADRIVADFAGLRTLDSVVRAKEVFQEDSLTVISQDFHVRRAIYIGSARDVDLVGFAARDVGSQSGIKTKLREVLAQVKAILDVTLLQKQPRHLGDPLPIGGDHGT